MHPLPKLFVSYVFSLDFMGFLGVFFVPITVMNVYISTNLSEAQFFKKESGVFINITNQSK